MLEIFTVFLRVLLAAALAIFALALSFEAYLARERINPFSPVGWLQERFLIAFVLALLALSLEAGSRRAASRQLESWNTLLTGVAISAVSVLTFLRDSLSSFFHQGEFVKRQ